jgi:predicted DNA-binding protein
MSALSVRIPDELSLNLEKTCESIERSKAYIVRKALEKYLDELQDHLTAELAYTAYIKNNKKSVDLKTVAKKSKVKLKHYK